jgi:hypothetical protein
MDDAMWNHAVFSKNRDRLLTSEVAQPFFAEVNRLTKPYMSGDHFTVNGTLIQAWASHKSFRAKDGSDDGDGTNFHGDKRSNETHESSTDPDARLYKKSYGKESQLAYLGRRAGGEPQRPDRRIDGHHSRRLRRTRSRSADAGTEAEGPQAAHHAGRGQGLRLEGFRRGRTQDECHRDKRGRSNLDRRTTRHPGYGISLGRRWLVEKVFGWMKQTGPISQVKLRGLHKVDWAFVFSCASCDCLACSRNDRRKAPGSSAPEQTEKPRTGFLQGHETSANTRQNPLSNENQPNQTRENQ